MQRFFLNVDYPLDTVKDPEGMDCIDLAAAQAEARVIIRNLAAGCLAQERMFNLVGISICNAAGDIFAHVSPTEAISEIIPLDSLTPSAPTMCQGSALSNRGAARHCPARRLKTEGPPVIPCSQPSKASDQPQRLIRNWLGEFSQL